MKHHFLILGLVLGSFSFAQNSDLGNWLIYIGNKKINSKWNIHNEVQYRNYDVIGDLEQLLLRAGVGYNLSENNNNILLGYGYILSENFIGGSSEKISVNEHRIFQQFINKFKIKRINAQNRFRLEERWIENADFRMRFRYFIGANIPITNSELVDKTWYGSFYNEIFLNHKDEIFDRNRLYFGAGYKLNKSLKFELGYMNQFLDETSRDQINIIAFVNF